MRVIIPAAGLGTRLRPHTHHRPKPLVHVAGSTVLGHVLDRLKVLDIDELVFIVGHLGTQIEAYVAQNYPEYQVSYVFQRELLGQAHALALAREHIHGETLIIFVDTIADADYAELPTIDADGVIHVQEVDDPRRFGIVELRDDGTISRFVEKPQEPLSNQAVVGIYYVRDGAWLLSAIDQLIASGKALKGEYYLADALQVMVEAGAQFVTRPVAMWSDCGTVAATIDTNRYLLQHQDPARLASAQDIARWCKDSVIVPPVHLGSDVRIENSVVGPFAFIGDGCRIERSIVGPFVSLADGATVSDSLLHDAIVDTGATIASAALMSSLIGAQARVRGRRERLNVGDSSEIDAGDSA